MSVGNNNPQTNSQNVDKNIEKKPNDFGGINVSSHIKIYDPNTKEVFVQKRGDD